MPNIKVPFAILSIFCLVFYIGLGTTADVRAQTQAEQAPPESEQTPAPEAEPDEETLPAQQWHRLELDAGRVVLQVPAEGWEVLTREDMQEQVGTGCVPRRLPEGLLLVVQNEQYASGVYLLKSPEEVVFIDEAGLESYAAEQREHFHEQFEDAVLVDTGIIRLDDAFYINRIEFEAPAGAGARGCASPQNNQTPKVFRQAIREHFVRPEGEARVVMYRAVAFVQKDHLETTLPVIENVITSFEYRGAKADSLFIPDAPENVWPEVSPSDRSQRPWLLYILVILGALYFWRRWNKSRTSTTST